MSATRILCVDDDEAVLKSFGQILSLQGFTVATVATVAEALDLINRQSFDVLLADLNIGQPGDGFTVVSAMRRVQPDACRFILTGYPDFESAMQAIRSQVDDYLPKPLKVDELMRAIQQVRVGRPSAAASRPPVKVAELLRSRRSGIAEQWLEEVLKNPELAAIPLTREERMDHVPALIAEMASRMDENREESSTEATEAARKHGVARLRQGYTIPQILFETRVLQHILSGTIQDELLTLELSSVIPDTFTVGESLQAAVEISIRAYQAQIPHSLQMSFSQLYRSPYLGVAIANENRIVDANDALLTMIHCTRAQLNAGEIDWMKMTPQNYRSLDLNALEQLREFGTCVPFEKEFLLPDGERLPFLIGAVRLSLEPFQWSVYMVDLTKQRAIQAAEQKLHRWESRHALINSLAHEINNPLAALVFTFHLLKTYEDLPAQAEELLEDANRMLDRMAESVRMVLIESRPVE